MKRRLFQKSSGGDGPEASTLACAIYAEFIAKTVRVLSPDIAEAVKLTENIFRSVNIALMNELKVVYECMGISIWEVIEAAKTKPFGFMPFYPGPGLGGHCIPIDPFYLTWKAREYNISTEFIELAGEINTAMPQYVIERTALALIKPSGAGLKALKFSSSVSRTRKISMISARALRCACSSSSMRAARLRTTTTHLFRR